MLHIAHILHIVYIQLFKSSLICCFNLLTGFYLSDDDENMPEDHSVPANDDQLPDSPVQQHFMPLQHDIRQSSPFDFHCTMRRLGGNPTSMFSLVEKIDDMLPAGPIVVHSGRAGEGARFE